MFSGGDSSDGINSLNQFGSYGFVNQVTVSNAMAAGQNIDWAQLAQQWIQMRDNSGLEAKAEFESPTNAGVEPSSNGIKFEEKGEADMDMDEEEPSDDKTQRYNSLGPSSDFTDNLHQSWYMKGNNSKLEPPASSNNQWNPWQNQEIPTMTTPSKSRLINPTAHIPSLLKMSVPNPNEIRVVPDKSMQPDTYAMDAAKKKVLPAWIREGLEKMEREKQKLLEKEQQNKEQKIGSCDEDNGTNNNTRKSKDSLHPATILDDDSSDNEHFVTVKGSSERDVNFKEVNNDDDNTNNSIGEKTYEQKLSEMMIVVRHTLTELLLEATNEEISKVADETIKIFKSKASSAQVIRKSALSTLTGKLGLAAYGDSSSENDSENEEIYLAKKTTDQSESSNDSEEEIRNAIRLKRRAFIKTSEEIEERVIASAVEEEEKLKYFLRKEEEDRVQDSSNPGHIGNSNFKGYEKDFGEITETKIQHINGKRQKERGSRRERITRFSDNKDKSVAIPNAATFLTNLNGGANFISSNNTSTSATNSQRQNVPDINGLLPNYASMGMANALSAADAALEKALNKGKAPTNSEKQDQRYERDRAYNQPKKRRLSEKKYSRSRSMTSSSSTSSSSSSTSSDSTSSSSRASNHSTYKHRSAKKHKARTFDERQVGKSNRDRRDDLKHSSRSYKNRDHQTNSRSLRNGSSDSEDDYRRRHRNESNHSHNSSSQKRSYTSSRYDRDREHSRSHSRTSYSSNNRRQ